MTTAAPTSVLATAAPTTTATTVVPTTAAPTTAPPTTVEPTSIAPTSVLATKAPTTLATTGVPTTVVPTTTATTAPPYEYNPDRDVVFNCKGNNYAGALIVTLTIAGNSLNASYGLAEGELAVVITIGGDSPSAALYSVGADELAMILSLEGWGVANDNKGNWVGWSKIGEASFILDRVNDAGFRPMAWTGYVYQVKKLSKGQGLAYDVVIYGSGGVTLATPVDQPHPTYGFKDLHLVGVKNKTAVGGDEFNHFFIDDTGALFRITPGQGLEYLGYEEFLNTLTNPVLTYNAADRRLYINDAEGAGYVFREDTLTGGQIGLTGLYQVKDNVTAVGPNTLSFAPVHICTDIIDFKRRGMKHIEDLQFGVSANMPLFAAIDYRYKKDESFRTTKWIRVNDEGVAHVPCSAVEFRIRLKSLVTGTFDLSYIKIQHKYIDQRFTRDYRENPIDAY